MLQTKIQTGYARLLRATAGLVMAGVLLSFTTGKHETSKTAKKIVLVVDAGHGGKDLGATSDGLAEKNLNLAVVNRIKELAPDYNVEVHLTRSDDAYISLEQRAAISNELKPDYFLSVHVNKRSGAQINICSNNNRDTLLTTGSKNLASHIFSSTPALSGAATAAKWYSDKRLYLLRTSNAPAVLIELGDIENKADMARLSDNVQLDELCNGILKGVVAAKG